jgi:hypothetical protein
MQQLKVRLHKQCGSAIFTEQCDFNRNLPIFSNRHRWGQRQHLMFCHLCKHYFTWDWLRHLEGDRALLNKILLGCIKSFGILSQFALNIYLYANLKKWQKAKYK